MPFFHAFVISPSSSYQTILFTSSALLHSAGHGSGFLSLLPWQRVNYFDDKTVPSTASSLPLHSRHPALPSRREPSYCKEFSVSILLFKLYAEELFMLLHSFSFSFLTPFHYGAPCFVYASTQCLLLSSWFTQSS